MSEQSAGSRRSFARPVMLLGLAALGVGALALYGIGGDDKAHACAATPETLASIKAAAKGEVAAVVTPSSPRPLPALSFKDASGAEVGLEKFKGKVVLLNLWATWCAPCRKEMPALDKLQGEEGGESFQVVPVSLDFGSDDKPKKFLSEIGAKNLALFHDPSGKLLPALKSIGRGTGLPTTLILDRSGCEIGYLPGPAEWASDEAKELVKASGYKGETLKLLGLPYGETWTRLAETIKQNFDEVGIKIEIVSTDVAGWTQRVSNFDYDLTFNYLYQFGDPATGVGRSYVTSNIVKGNPFGNVGQYSNPEVDRLFAEGAKATSDKRQEIYSQVQKIMADDLPVLWLLELDFPTVSRCNVKDLVTTGIGINDAAKNVWKQ